MKFIIQKLQAKQNLELAEIKRFLEGVIRDEVDLDTQKTFLILLNEKGYTGKEVAYFIKVLESEMAEVLNLPGAIDICGTGGSELPRINTSTTCAFILSSLGVPVAKHGNKAASGRFGSFDLLEALGIDIMNAGDQLELLFHQTHLAFIYARKFHPAIKHFAEVRRQIGHKTIFNLLGPLLNPANPSIQVIGVSDKNDARLMIEAAMHLGKEKVLVLHGSNHLDELTLTGSTHVIELENGQVHEYSLTPSHFGFNEVSFDEIASSGNDFNVQISKDILSGKCNSRHLNLVLANCALILKFLGLATTYRSGVEMARNAIEEGLPIAQLEKYARLSKMPSILQRIHQQKIEEVEKLKQDYPIDLIGKDLEKSDRDFKKALKDKNKLSFICEIKNASPSDPVINVNGKSVEEMAQLYEENGAAALSVLTDEKFFKGSLENLKITREKTEKVPILMKDFIVDEHQIYVGRHFGADAVLLIAAMLNIEEMNHLIDVARSLNMDVLVEIHNEEELKKTLQTSAEIIGVNNRDLHTFNMDPQNALKLIPQIPSDKITVAESGYNENEIRFLHGFSDAVLLGSSLMKSENPSHTLSNMIQPQKLFKACGIRTVEAARFCEENKVSLVGLNFVSSSHRCVDLSLANQIRNELKNTKVVGVFQNQSFEEVQAIANELRLDFVQLSGDELPAYCAKINQPVIKTLAYDQLHRVAEYDSCVTYYIVDGKVPGSGEVYDYARLSDVKLNRPFLIAGGVNPDNASDILKKVPQALGLDSASGIEEGGEVGVAKIASIINITFSFRSRRGGKKSLCD